jgi:hypothetical protein
MLIATLWMLIAVTFVCWCVPMLFLPRPVLRSLQIPIREPMLFVRLLGATNLALCLHYFLGILRLQHGHESSDVVVIGLIHCGMSAAVIWRFALHGHYEKWPRATTLYVYSSGGLLTALALALLAAGLWYG